MNRLRLLTIIPILVFSLESEAMPKDRYPVNPGVDIIHYAFHIILSDSTDRIKARAEITAHLDGSLSRLDLDLTGPGLSGKGMEIRRVAAGETTLSWRHENNRAQIDLPASGASNRNLTITIEYEGIPTDGLIISKNKFGDRSFFGDNWPDRARCWLPCTDPPCTGPP